MDALVGTHLLCTARLPFALTEPAGNKALVVVETRPMFFLPHVVASFVNHHPDWRLYVFGSPCVHALLAAQCKNYERVNSLTLQGVGARMSTKEYSDLLLTEAFWRTIKEEHVLVFQADCLCVRPTPDDFLKFDFVGARCGPIHTPGFIMNGGLSLRRRSAMLRAVHMIRDRMAFLLQAAEDVAFCTAMRTGGFNLPTATDCDNFAIESLGNPDAAVGMHGTDKYYAPLDIVARLLGIITTGTVGDGGS